MAQTSSTADSRTESENARAPCEYGPLATSRKRVAAACRCVACKKTVAEPSVRRLLEVGTAFASRSAPLAALTATLQEAETAAAAADRRASAEVWSVFEGLRAGEAADSARRIRTVTSATRWALGLGGAAPAVSSEWRWLQSALADSRPAPVCDPDWRTRDVLALARLVWSGDTSLLPILADALQDAGCNDDRILDHCRSAEPHGRGCWVPDLILDAE